MEPERDIEKDLKAYGQQRRAAAGTPPPLHPANRKALQAEAARLAKSPAAKPRSWWQTFFGSWAGLAVTGAAAATVVIAGLHLLAPPENKQERIQSFAAGGRHAEEPKTMLAPAPKPAETPAPQPMVLAERSESRTRFPTVVPENGPSPVPSPPPAALPAAAAPEPPPTTVTLAATTPAPTPIAAPAAATPPPSAKMIAPAAPAARDRESLVSSGLLAKDATGDAPAGSAFGGANSVSPGSFNRLVATDGFSTMITQRFRRTDLPTKAAKRFSASNLLSSFKVEQDLGKLRVIDGDGSVYAGFVEQTAEDFKQSDALLKKETLDKSVVQSKTERPMQAFHFRVSGTNRTLKQEVVFTGNFLNAIPPQPGLVTNTFANTVSGTVAPGAAGQPALFDLQKARMEGNLLLGGTNRLEIKAAPVKR